MLLDHLVHTLQQAQMGLLLPHLDGLMDSAVHQVSEDVQAYAERDPASGGRSELILDSYASFKAVLYHRLAHQVWRLGELPDREIIAYEQPNTGKLQSGVEIHPAARIGRRFVLDHGFGTVIGETCEIGDDCYLLSGVTLGACSIADNPGGKRHPRLGHSVEVGAGARIPRRGGHRRPRVHQPGLRDHPRRACQHPRQHRQPAATAALRAGRRRGFLGAFALGERLHLVGELPDAEDISVLDADHHPLACLRLECTVRERHHRQYRLRNLGAVVPPPCYPLHLRVDGQDITLLDPPGLSSLVRTVLKPLLA